MCITNSGRYNQSRDVNKFSEVKSIGVEAIDDHGSMDLSEFSEGGAFAP